MSLARSASGPPSFPVHASRTACFWAGLALLLTYTTTRQLPLSTFPGIWATMANVVPLTSTPSIVPLSIRYARKASQTPPCGSSPIQHGHGAPHEHASRSEPCTRYLVLAITRSPSPNDGERSDDEDQPARLPRELARASNLMPRRRAGPARGGRRRIGDACRPPGDCVAGIYVAGR